MGSLDSNNIWQYDNADHVTPLATFMNLLATSVSNAFETFRTEILGLLPQDTGWLPMNASTDTTVSAGYDAQARQIGSEVRVRVRSSRTTWATNQLWFTLPAGITAPSRTTELVPNRAPSNLPTRVQVGSDGTIRTPQAAGSGTMNVWLNDAYWVG